MCGIAGLVGARLTADWPLRARRALGDLAHRGPDDQGWWVWHRDTERSGAGDTALGGAASVVLLHRRLAILDLSAAGHQPMQDPSGRFTVVLNGEIYNFVELRDTLVRNGFTFRTRTDTEVLLASLVAWGLDACTRWVGMFAVAVMDAQTRRVVLIRDPFGIKPLYYARSEGGWAFASEVPALLRLSGASRRVEPARLFRYLRWGETDHGEGTLFADVRQVPSGSRVELSTSGEARTTRYWTPQPQEPASSFDAAVRDVREAFLESIGIHLRSDVPVGAALSGGIDSSAIVCAMRYVAGRSLDLHTFSYVADDPAISEESWVDLINGRVGATAHKIRIDGADLVRDLDVLLDVQGEPFGSPRLYAQYRVFQAARAVGIPVMLDGQGAYELLGGYRYFLGARFAVLARQGRWWAAARFARRAGRQPGITWRGVLTQAGPYLVPPGWQAAARRLVGRETVPNWLNRQWLAERGAIPALEGGRQRPGRLRDALLDTLLESSLPHLLRHEDRNAMAFSVESRVPFLTPAFAELVLGQPDEFLIAADGVSKAVFRAAMRGIVPDPVLDRRDKVGFEVPERAWMLAVAPWVEETLSSPAARAIPAFNLPAVMEAWLAMRAGRRAFDWSAWRWVNLVRWAERFGAEFS